MVAQSDINMLVDSVRAMTGPDGLRAVGRFAFEADCAIVTNGVGFRQQGENIPLVTGNGTPISGGYRIVQDHSLSALGIEVLVSNIPQSDLTHRACVGLLLYRAGILLKILDKSYDHLNGRISGGQRILRHQLIKATFVECFALAERVRSEVRFLLETGVKVELSSMHEELSSATIKASKLMGGHGFLAAELNPLEFLSLCIFNQSITRPCAAIRDKAA